MGLFDYVIFEAPCAKCGAPLRDWQTKSAPDPYLESLTPDKIVGGVFYTSCRSCGSWNEFEVVPTGYLIRRVGAPDNDATLDALLDDAAIDRARGAVIGGR